MLVRSHLDKIILGRNEVMKRWLGCFTCSWYMRNRPCLIYQYCDMALQLSEQTSILDDVFYVSKSLLGIVRQNKLKRIPILTWKPRSQVGISGILNVPCLLILRCVQLGHFSFKDTLQSLNLTVKVAEKLMNVIILRIFKTLRARFFNKIQDWILTCKSERILKWILQNRFFGSFDTDHHRKCKIHLRILPV